MLFFLGMHAGLLLSFSQCSNDSIFLGQGEGSDYGRGITDTEPPGADAS